MPTTIYKRLNDREFIYSRNDLRKIAYWTHEHYITENDGKDPERTEQLEDDKVFQVFEYPDEWIEIIDSITDWYFKRKRKVGEQHLKREQHAREVKLAREKKILEGENPTKPKNQKKSNKNFNPANKNQQNFNNNKSGFNKGGNKNFKPKQQGDEGYNSQKSNNYRPHNNKPTSNNRPNNNRPGNSNNRPNNNYRSNNNRPGFNKFQPYPNNPDNRQIKDRKTFNSYDSDIQNDGDRYNNYKNSAPRTSYYENSNAHRLNQKVEINSQNDVSSDGTKKRKRIAKALFVAAPEVKPEENVNS